MVNISWEISAYKDPNVQRKSRLYCNAFSATFTAVRCFQLRKKVLRLDATSYQSWDRTVLSQEIFTINEIGIFRITAEWYVLLFAKFRSSHVKNKKVMTENLSKLNALALITEPP